MSRHTVLLAVAAIVATASTITLARQQTPPPAPTPAGSMTTARFYILNKAKAEAVPVTLVGVDEKFPTLNVVVENLPVLDPAVRTPNPVSIKAVAVVTSAPQNWEYSEVTVRDEDVASTAALLNRAGMNGWETTGLSSKAGPGTVYIMKRPK